MLLVTVLDGFVYYVVNIDLDDVVGYGFVYYVVNIDLDDVVGYGFVYYVVDLDDVVGLYIMWST